MFAIDSTTTLANGVEMPRLGLGVFKAGAGDSTRNAVRRALDVGYRHIDTAAIYRNEEEVGDAIRSWCEEHEVAREEIFVTTKLWNDDHGYDEALEAYATSTAKLGLEYVDLYLLHWPVPGKRLDSWRALERLLEQEKVRAIGVSNFTTRHIEQLLDVPGGEVADADGAHLLLLEQALERSPGVEALPGHRPMQQVEVHILEPELGGARRVRLERLVIPVVIVPELGGHEDLLARHLVLLAPTPYSVADLLLVPVDRRRVDVAVSYIERASDRVSRGVPGARLEDAEAKPWHLDAVGQCGGAVDSEHGCSLFRSAGEVGDGKHHRHQGDEDLRDASVAVQFLFGL